MRHVPGVVVGAWAAVLVIWIGWASLTRLAIGAGTIQAPELIVAVTRIGIYLVVTGALFALHTLPVVLRMPQASLLAVELVCGAALMVWATMQVAAANTAAHARLVAAAAIETHSAVGAAILLAATAWGWHVRELRFAADASAREARLAEARVAQRAADIERVAVRAALMTIAGMLPEQPAQADARVVSLAERLRTDLRPIAGAHP